MKKLMYLLSVVGVALCMSLSVSAFTGSAYQKGGEITSAAVKTASGKTVTLQIVASGDLNSTTEPAIMLSSVENVLDGKSGLPENATELVKTVYEAVTTQTTSKFLDELTDATKEAFEQAVGGAANVDNYEALTMVDITLNDAAKALLEEGGSVDIDMNVSGVTTSNNPVALHITDDNLAGEVLPSKVTANGVVTVTMTSFSPVVVFVEKSATTGSGTTSTGSGNVSTSVATSGNTYMMAGTVALVAAAGIGVYSFAHKKDED